MYPIKRIKIIRITLLFIYLSLTPAIGLSSHKDIIQNLTLENDKIRLTPHIQLNDESMDGFWPITKAKQLDPDDTVLNALNELGLSPQFFRHIYIDIYADIEESNKKQTKIGDIILYDLPLYHQNNEGDSLIILHWIGIDKKYQKKKYGSSALELLLQATDKIWDKAEMYLCLGSRKLGVYKMYTKYGFKPFLLEKNHQNYFYKSEDKVKYTPDWLTRDKPKIPLGVIMKRSSLSNSHHNEDFYLLRKKRKISDLIPLNLLYPEQKFKKI
jgi:GNAT superfamily N-acetyltransferase